eukprot:m.132069 g.132069  ORF g.132069 m.132069 type:complete len:64 (+) comp29585_c3_seq2:1976-2167(+)
MLCIIGLLKLAATLDNSLDTSVSSSGAAGGGVDATCVDGGGGSTVLVGSDMMFCPLEFLFALL